MASFPDRYAQLTPQVLPYANSIIWLPPDLFVQAGVHSINASAVLVLIVICGNVALLMLTRTATREREILVRTALGATRGRILTQLLLEALLLAALALALGLTATNALLKATADMLRASPEDRWPFWLDAGLSPATVWYAGALTLLAAIIVGVVPGVKVMGRGMSDRLRQSTAGGGGLRMGRVWTGLIVTQIAATVLFTAIAYVVHRQAEYLTSVKTVFPTTRYLSVRLEMESEGAAEDAASAIPARHRQTFAAAVRELERRLANEAAVAGVTVAEQLPLMATTNSPTIEVSGAGPADQSRRAKVGASAVAPNLFGVFQMPVLAGRTFDSRDLNENANTVVVNGVFVDRILGGRNAVGQRIRYESVEPTDDRRSAEKPGPWLEIIGVVRDLEPDGGAPLNLDNPARPRLYHCLDVSRGSKPLYLAVLARTDPQSLAPTVRRIAGVVNPMLRLHDILPLDHHVSGDARFWRVFANVFLLGSAIVLFLSLAGIYSVTSFTVSRRTREIAVRVALGAPASRVIASIFRRPLLQVAAGVVAGCGLLAVVAFARSGSGAAMARQAALLVAYGIAVMGVCVIACLGPALRALRLDPAEALREDA
jgi:predicted permease